MHRLSLATMNTLFALSANQISPRTETSIRATPSAVVALLSRFAKTLALGPEDQVATVGTIAPCRASIVWSTTYRMQGGFCTLIPGRSAGWTT